MKSWTDTRVENLVQLITERITGTNITNILLSYFQEKKHPSSHHLLGLLEMLDRKILSQI